MKNKCFWSHNWSTWKETKRAKLTSFETKMTVGEYILQERQCEDCGFKEINKQTEYII